MQVKLNALDEEPCRSLADLYVAELCSQVKPVFNLLEFLLEF